MTIKRKILILSAIAMLAVLIVPAVASAALPTIVPSCALGTVDPKTGVAIQAKTPDLNCVELLLVNIAKWILGISGAIALLMFIYGGFLWLTSGGESGKIESGRKIMVGTVIGLVIIFGANLGITAIQNALKGNLLGGSGSQGGTTTGGGGAGGGTATPAPETPTSPENGCCVFTDAKGNVASCADTPRGSCGTGSDRYFDQSPCAQIYFCQQLQAGGGGEETQMGCCGVNTPTLKKDCSVNWTPGACSGGAVGCCSYMDNGTLFCGDKPKTVCEEHPYSGTWYEGKTCKSNPTRCF